MGVISILSGYNSVSKDITPGASGANVEIEPVLSGALIVSRSLQELERLSVAQNRAWREGVVVSKRSLSA
jgi:hypothetical protein